MQGYPYSDRVQPFAQPEETVAALDNDVPIPALELFGKLCQEKFNLHPKFAFCEVILGSGIQVALNMPIVPTILCSVATPIRGSNVLYVDLTDPDEYLASANPRYDLVFCSIPDGAEEEMDLTVVAQNVGAICKNSVWYAREGSLGDVLCAGHPKWRESVEDEDGQYCGTLLHFSWKK